MIAVKKMLFFVLILVATRIFAQTEGSISLAGNWYFKVDSLNEGEAAKWYNKPPSFFKQLIKLPGTMDDAGIGNPVNVQPALKREVMLHLWRKVSYTGAAWYKKQVSIPASWNKKHIELFLERVLWQTNVWVDGKKLNATGESLVAPHTFDLSNYLHPGKHTISVRIDNSRKYDISLGDANFAHAYTNETQIIWNGAIGKIELRSTVAICIENLQVFPDVENKSIRVVSTINNTLDKVSKATIYLSAVNGKSTNAETNLKATLNPGLNEIIANIPLRDAIKNWDEFHPSLYRLNVSIKSGEGIDKSATSFGIRTITNNNARLQINNRPLFLRGTLECSIFPKQGHAPMEKSGWIKVFTTAKMYGLNHLRFHSWCPPEAAFAAADEMGFYLQVELPVWSLKIGTDKPADEFLKAEAKRITQYYGNHPSFCFWSMGNEMQGNMQWLSDEVMALKTVDKRRLYTTTSFTFEEGFGKWPVEADDYLVTQYTKKGWVRGQGIFDTEAPSFNKDYTAAVSGLPVPLISHEVGQYAIYPSMKELPKYTGVLKPVNFIAVKNDLQKKNLLPMATDFTKSSGKLAVLLYKEEIERALKTKGVSGFQLLDLHDFPGQGTALVGILDAFWDSKGLISANDFREFCSPVVPLIRFAKATYTNDETFTASIEVANFSAAAISNAVVNWQITAADKKVIAKGKLTPATIAIGNGIIIGNISSSLAGITSAKKVTVSVNIENTNYQNHWSIWVYPKQLPTSNSNVVFTTNFKEAIDALREGKNVLLNPAKQKINGVEGKFVPVFWSPVHFPNQPGTMGLLINPSHPAFTNFPTDEFTNWQWWDLCKQSTTLVLDSAGINPAVIVLRDIDNFFKNRNMASIIEAKSGNGKLLICTMDINNDLGNRPAAAQLKYSLIQYINGNKFNPVVNLNETDLKKIIKQ
jgi:hypothetical protein